MGSCEPSVIVDESSCEFPDGMVGELGNSLGDMGGVTLDPADKARDFQGCTDAVIDPESLTGAGCKLVNCVEDSIGRLDTEQLFCSEVACLSSNTDGDTTVSVESCCHSSQNIKATLLGSNIALGVSTSGRNDWNWQQNKDGSVLEQKPQDESAFSSYHNASGDTTSPVDGFHASSKKAGPTSADIILEVPVSGLDDSTDRQQGMGGLIYEQKLQNEYELSGLCSHDQDKHLCYLGTMGLDLGRQGSSHEDDLGQLMGAEEMSLALVPLTVSQSKSIPCVEEKVQMFPDFKEVKEEQCDAITRISVSLSSQASLKEDSTCNLMVGPHDVASDDAVEKEVSQLCDFVNTVSCESLSVPDYEEACASDCALICEGRLDSTLKMYDEDRGYCRPDNFSGPLEETATDSQEVVEQKFDVLLGQPGDLSCQELRIEENICSLMQRSLNVASKSSGEESTSLQSSLPLNVVTTVSSKISGEPDLEESTAVNGHLTCNGMVDPTGSAISEGKANCKPHFVLESSCANSVHVLLRRSTRVSKLNQMNDTRKVAIQCNNKFNSSLPKSAIGISFKIVRRKRSYPCKPARSSTWGVYGNIMQVFEQNEGILKQDSELILAQTCGSWKSEGFIGSKKQKRTRASKSRKPDGENGASSGCVRLKVKMGKSVGQNNLTNVLHPGDTHSACEEAMINESLCELNCKTGLEIPSFANDVEMEQKLEEDVRPSIRILETATTPLDVSALDAHLADKDLVSIVTEDLSAGNLGDCHVSSQIGTELGEASETKNSDPGTSPHSEVINVIQEVQVGAEMQADLQDASSDLAHDVVCPEDVVCSNILRVKEKRGKRNGKTKGSQNPVGGRCAPDDKMHGPTNLNESKKSSRRRSRQKGSVDQNPCEAIILATSQNVSSNYSSNEGSARESFPSSGLVEPGLSHETLKIGAGIEACGLPNHDVGNIPQESSTLELPVSKPTGRKVSKTSKSSAAVSKCRSHASDSVRGRRKNACEKEDMWKSNRKSKDKEEVLSVLDAGQQENYPEIGGNSNVPFVKKDSEAWEPDELSRFNLVANETSSSLARKSAGNNVPAENISSSNVVSNGLMEQSLPPRIAWVCCDDCHKWRCISAALADYIEEAHCRWACKDNEDKAFANCSIPQEKSNAEINAELEISDASGEEDAYDRRSNHKALEVKQPKVPQQAPWRHIKSNLFLHRNRKTQTIDEIMVCHCKPPLGGSVACGDECLNRMLNIECVKGACPCGDHCSNQQFQKRNYAKFKCFRCGKKGFGLQLLEDVSEGQFLIEYVGEVLDLHDYEARQREYASRGQKHFYFMTLNGSEVIDACAKGNLGRFINHSCEPNCRTEKWMVNGEICIGLFAMRNIKKGEEVTFDYNYVRVYGAAAKKCVCGSSVCRGYIGGDPLDPETIIRDDSDEEFPEPLMFDEGGGSEINTDVTISSISSVNGAGTAAQYAEVPMQAGDAISKPGAATVGANIFLEKENTLSRSICFGELSQSEISLKVEDSLSKSLSTSVSPQAAVQREDGMGKTSSSTQLAEVSLTKEETTDKDLSDVQALESSSSTVISVKKSMSSSVGTDKSRSDIVEGKPKIPKSRSHVKASRSSSSIEKGRSTVYPVITNKPLVVVKPRKQVDGVIRSRFEGVEDKLNELLDGDGGISKRKDASKGYLKLLVLTAASRDNGNSEAFQSARDLSIILDALMKTKSRTVLTDVINKNGLQMLHNILKQNRGDFKKIPILRKLLKVLEFLALKGILTFEHINGGPPRPGMESFKDSILTLTRHNDVQVHQIARTFRDRWIPRYNRRFNYFDRDDSKLEPQSGPNNGFASSCKRWHDQGARPMEVINCVSQATIVATPVETNTQESSSVPAIGSCPVSGTRKRKRKSRWDQPAETKVDPSLQHIEEQHIEPNSEQKLDPSPLKLEINDTVLDQVIDVNREKKIRSGCVNNFLQQDEVSAGVDLSQHIEDDVPPGFASHLSGPAGPSNISTSTSASLPSQNASPSDCGFEVVTAHPQERFLPHLPVSYGIPCPLVQQFGMLQPETTDCWSIAPGVPFHPFPPLPPFPREKSNPLPSPSAADPMVMDGHGAAVQQHRQCVVAHNMDPSVPSSSGARPDAPVTRDSNRDVVERTRGSSYGLGRKYFRQRKWNDSVTARHHGRRDNWEYKGNNSRNGIRSVIVGNVANESGSHCGSQGLNTRDENVSSSFCQHTPTQYRH